jgi:6-phosphogluconolactonase
MDPDIRVFQDLQVLSQATAQILSDQALQAIDDRGRFLLVLNGGSTPIPLFRLLASDRNMKIDWKYTHIFWGDERCVATDDPESSYGQAHDLFLRLVDIPEENVHRIKGELGPLEAAKDYAAVLQKFADPDSKWPHFDLVLLGMGEDGHTASLFPGITIDPSSPTMAVTAHYQDRPSERTTLTPSVFNDARMILFMVVGENKASTLRKVLDEPNRQELYPAQRIKPKDGKIIWLVDKAAASQLPKRMTRSRSENKR